MLADSCQPINEISGRSRANASTSTAVQRMCRMSACDANECTQTLDAPLKITTEENATDDAPRGVFFRSSHPPEMQ